MANIFHWNDVDSLMFYIVYVLPKADAQYCYDFFKRIIRTIGSIGRERITFFFVEYIKTFYFDNEKKMVDFWRTGDILTSMFNEYLFAYVG